MISSNSLDAGLMADYLIEVTTAAEGECSPPDLMIKLFITA